MHKVMLTQLTSIMTVEVLKQWVSTMRMMDFTVSSAKTMAQSRAGIVNAIIDCDQPSKSAPANVEGQAGVVNPGRPGTASALRLGQSQASKPVASSSMEYAPAADTVFGISAGGVRCWRGNHAYQTEDAQTIVQTCIAGELAQAYSAGPCLREGQSC